MHYTTVAFNSSQYAYQHGRILAGELFLASHPKMGLGILRVWLCACIQLTSHVGLYLLPELAHLPKPSWKNACKSE